MTGNASQAGTDQTRATTVADIAEAAGVSTTTVSLVLNGRARAQRIAKTTEAKVLDVARELQYAPNELARSLRRQQTGDVGVLLPHLLNDWAHYIMEGVEGVLDTAGLVPLIVNHRGSATRSRRGLDALVRRQVCGVICNPMQDEEDHYRRVIERGMPFVFLGDVPEGFPNASFAAWDPAECAEPVRHLASLGRRRILFLGHADERRLSNERYAAVRTALHDAGLPADDDHVVLRPMAEGFDAAVRAAFTERPAADRPDAIFALFDDVAMRALDVLRCLGLRVPDDVAVAATGTGLDAGFRAYGLTIMKAPVVEEGAAATRLLLDRLQGRVSRPEEMYVRGGELVVSRTTAGEASPLAHRSTSVPDLKGSPSREITPAPSGAPAS